MERSNHKNRKSGDKNDRLEKHQTENTGQGKKMTSDVGIKTSKQ